MADLPIQLDRARRIPLAAQIYSAIREGIENGRLVSGARLPSWQDLAAQLGVSRGTVRMVDEPRAGRITVSRLG
jgi:GntR family transcriptional regulator / MocR family aminotransferase